MKKELYRTCRAAVPVIVFVCLLQSVNSDAPLLDAAALPLEHRGIYGPPPPLPPGPGPLPSGNGIGPGPDDPWPLATPDQPQIKHLQVQCEKTHMRVNIEFDRPFYGMIFSKGFYSDPHCVHLKPGTGHLSATFEIFLNSCGMSSSANHNAHGGYTTPSGSYVENTIIIQYDPYVQEVWDQARKLRCTWYDFYEKAVTFRPFQVDMLHAVTANFLGDNLQCWMQIQVGKGPWASEVSGIVKIGQTMTMVLAIKDDENKFDMLVRNCVAHDGKRAPIQLVDQHGCVVRHKIMSKFQKIKNFGPSASVVSFAYFQAFKFPDSMNVHFQCVIQVCRYNCPEPHCGGDYAGPQLGGIGGGEYGPPPPPPQQGVPQGVPHQEYGLPDYGGLGFPDPRHPSGPTGAYSEQKSEVVPPPSATGNGNSNNNNNNNNGNGNNGNGNGTTPSTFSTQKTSPSNSINEANDIHLPPPPLPGHQNTYTTVKRKGTVDDEGNLAVLGGRPRSVELPVDSSPRRRRSPEIVRTIVVSHVYKREAQEMTDVNTSRTIQVVAPGDVNFALSPGSANNETVVVSSRTTESDSICISVSSFVAGLSMLLAILVVACLVAAFLFVRVRTLDRKGFATAFVHGGFDPSEFVKVTS